MREFESIWKRKGKKTKQNLMPGSMAGRTKVALLKASSSKLSSTVFLFFFTSFWFFLSMGNFISSLLSILHMTVYSETWSFRFKNRVTFKEQVSFHFQKWQRILTQSFGTLKKVQLAPQSAGKENIIRLLDGVWLMVQVCKGRQLFGELLCSWED